MRGPLSVAIAIVGLVLWADLFVTVLRPQFKSEHFPTSTYWVAPRMVWDGRGHELYDTDAFAAAAVEYGAIPDRGFIPNAPPGVVPLLPFGLLPEAPAYFLWTALSLTAAVTALALLLRLLGMERAGVLFTLAVVPLFQPLRHNFSVGQEFTFVLLAAVGVGLAGAKSRGLSGAAGSILKSLYGLVTLVPAFLGRRWRELGLALAVLGAACVTSAFIVGIDGWRTWIETTIGWRERPEVTATAYQTLTSLFGRLFRYELEWNPAPVADAPLLENLLFYLAAGTMVVLTVTAIARRSLPSLLWPLALLTPVAVLISPIAEDYHYVLTLLPIVACGWWLTRRPRSRAATVLLVTALFLIGPPWPFANQSPAGWWSLLFYPRVYGAVALWLSLVLVARSNAIDRGR